MTYWSDPSKNRKKHAAAASMSPSMPIVLIMHACIQIHLFMRHKPKGCDLLSILSSRESFCIGKRGERMDGVARMYHIYHTAIHRGNRSRRKVGISLFVPLDFRTMVTTTSRTGRAHTHTHLSVIRTTDYLMSRVCFREVRHDHDRSHYLYLLSYDVVTAPTPSYERQAPILEVQTLSSSAKLATAPPPPLQCARVCAMLHIYIYMHACMYACTHVCMHACMHVVTSFSCIVCKHNSILLVFSLLDLDGSLTCSTDYFRRTNASNTATPRRS